MTAERWAAGPARAASGAEAGQGGLHRFVWLWLGLTLSACGSELSGFALGLWLYQRTGFRHHL